MAVPSSASASDADGGTGGSLDRPDDGAERPDGPAPADGPEPDGGFCGLFGGRGGASSSPPEDDDGLFASVGFCPGGFGMLGSRFTGFGASGPAAGGLGTRGVDSDALLEDGALPDDGLAASVGGFGTAGEGFGALGCADGAGFDGGGGGGGTLGRPDLVCPPVGGAAGVGTAPSDFAGGLDGASDDGFGDSRRAEG
ncbi:MAG: hypothetical protein D6725_07405 [Planctomycetota bacterium]|nr:MAG: hypothetical protein D6725_07405 [Planctomycetota bacterium]